MPLFTIQKNARQEIIIEKSRFICSLIKADSEDAAQSALRALKKEFWDATHNCFAYIIENDAVYQRSGDDGEPSGTAGLPMLEALKKRGLHNVLAVTARYFGGIKLGAGGLSRAYGKSVAAALEQAGLCEKVPVTECVFSEQAAGAGRALNLLYRQKLFSVTGVSYGSRTLITISLRQADIPEAGRLLAELLGRPVELLPGKKRYIEVPCERKI